MSVSTQSVLQQERSPAHGSLVGTHAPVVSHRRVVVLQTPVQHSAFAAQVSPWARHQLWKEQRPPRQTWLQQLLQASPSAEQPALPAHLPAVQTPEQQATGEVQAAPRPAQTWAVEQVRVAGSQESEQQSTAAAQAAPARLH